MRITKQWTVEEVNLLKERYHIDGPKLLAEKLDRTKQSVTRKAHQMGLLSGRKTTSVENQLRRLHTLTRERAATNKSERVARRKNNAKKNTLAAHTIRIERRSKGCCIKCNSVKLPNSQYCLKHWAVICGASCNRYDAEFGKQLLAKLESQNYRCAISGDVLIPGWNTSIDHKIPRSLNGKLDDLDNLQWVTCDANRGKGTLSMPEYIALCQRVISHSLNSAT